MLLINEGLLYSIVREGDAQKFVKYAQRAGAKGATVFLAKGTASGIILKALGLGSKIREVVLVVTNQRTAEKIVSLAKQDSKIEGVSIFIDGEGDAVMDSKYKLITIIVNSGYSEDVMFAARKAGATGGTVAHARGTAPNDGSDKFFGVVVVPEKEMIFIISEAEKAQKIVDAVKNLDCLQKPGIGIIYTQNVKEFINLGRV